MVGHVGRPGRPTGRAAGGNDRHGRRAVSPPAARQALERLPGKDYLRRGPAAALLGLAYWAGGDLEDAHRALAGAMADFKQAGNLHFAISGTYGLADIRIVQGRLREAVRTYERSLQLAEEQGEPVLRGTADLFLGLAELYCERGDAEAAARHLWKSEALGEQAALPDWPCRLCLVQARIREARGDLDGALDRLQKAERLYYRTPIPDTRPIAARTARLWVRQGRPAEALAWARDRGLSADDELSYLREYEHITLARVLLARDEHDRPAASPDEAMGLLGRLLEAAEKGGRMGSVIEILLLQALTRRAQGELPTALALLERAMALAAPEGYVRIFLDEGLPMARLLTEAVAREIMPDAAGTLLAAFDGEKEKVGAKTHPHPQPLIEPLSPRELEILQLIAQGLSNREIGERLFLALSTVKGHNQNIFGKLEVQRRTEAVARARKLGLL